MPTLVKTRSLIVTLSHDDVEIERTTAADGKSAVKVAPFMLAKRDALWPGDVLRVDADG